MAVDISDLPAPPKQSVDISDLPPPTRAATPAPTRNVSVPTIEAPRTQTPTAQKKPEQTLAEKGKDVVTSGAIGAGMGAIAPELLTGAGALSSVLFPPAAPYLFSMGQLARGARAASAVTGGFAGAGGALAGKIVPDPEKVVVDIPGIQITRKQLAETAGEFAGPAAPKAIETFVRGLPLLRNAAVGLEKMAGLGEAEFRKAAENQLATLRGKLPATSVRAYGEVFSAISAFDDRTKRLALADMNAATERAQRVINHYNQQAQRIAGFNTQEAQEMQKGGAVAAQKIIDDAAALIQRKYGIVRKAEAAGTTAERGGQEALSSIGNANRSRADIGAALQNKVVATDDAEVKALEAAFKTDKSERDKIVAAKEAGGVFPENTSKFQEMMRFLNDKLVKGQQPPERQKIDVTEPSVRSAYERVRDALVNKQVLMDGTPAELAPLVKKIQEAGGQVRMGTNPATGEPAVYRVYKTSFEAMDQVRRKLGDAFAGKPPEGFEGLLKDQAKDLYGRIRAIQVEYAGGPGGAQDNLLKNYSEGKELLNALRIPAGRKVAGTDRLNPEYLTMDPSDIPAGFFKSKKSVQDLLQITKDPALVEQSAADYVARTLSGKKAGDVQKFLKDNKEWIDLFPGLSARISGASSALQRAESVGPKTSKLAEGLRTEIKTIPGISEKSAAEVRAKTEKDIAERLRRSESTQQRVRETGQKLAQKDKTAAEEALKVVEADPLTGKGDPVATIEKLITSGQTQQLERLAPIIKSDPAALQQFNEALDITLSRMSPANVIDDFERIIKPALLTTGLITRQKAAQLTQQLKAVQLTLEPSAVQQTASWLIRTAVSGETARLFRE